jgi:acyl-CoA dehydrogenase
MDFDLPADLQAYLKDIDVFIEAKLRPLEQQDDNVRFFDHRREDSRTDWEKGGLPRHEWEELLNEAKRLSDEAGFLRFTLPKEYGGQNGSNLWMAVVREHLARKGIGLHNDLQHEHSIVANWPAVRMLTEFGTQAQRDEFMPGLLDRTLRIVFGLTEPDHGSDLTFLEARAVPETRDGQAGWLINGEKTWTTGMHNASHCAFFARTSGDNGSAKGITCFLIPTNDPGVKIEEYLWTFNMPTDHARVSYKDIWVPDSAILGTPDEGLSVAQIFVHQNRIRQSASSLGAATYCIEETIKYAKARKPFGKALATNQGVQFPIVELATRAEMLRQLIRKTAWEMDRMPEVQIQRDLSDKVSMCNYSANRLACDAADQAMQTHGGLGYSRHKPFEHIYRHHRRYRITEGADEIQMRKIAGYLFGFMGPRKDAGATS